MIPFLISGGNRRICAGLLRSWLARPPASASAAAGTSRGSSSAIRVFRIAPKTATPNNPPIDRKKVAAAVATPRSA